MKKRKKMLMAGFGIIAISSINPSSALCKRTDELLLEKANSNGSVV